MATPEVMSWWSHGTDIFCRHSTKCLDCVGANGSWLTVGLQSWADRPGIMSFFDFRTVCLNFVDEIDLPGPTANPWEKCKTCKRWVEVKDRKSLRKRPSILYAWCSNELLLKVANVEAANMWVFVERLHSGWNYGTNSSRNSAIQKLMIEEGKGKWQIDMDQCKKTVCISVYIYNILILYTILNYIIYIYYFTIH